MKSVGTRVGAIRNANEETVYLYGYGTYVGDEIPPVEKRLFGLEIPNPKIVLDNGSVVWGRECWWGSEEQIKEMIGNRKVEIVEVS